MKPVGKILADGRWSGPHGIGRFSAEILSRLQNTDIFVKGPKPLSLSNLIWQSIYLQQKKSYSLFFSPGFNPVIYAPMPFVITVHDLIHLSFSEDKKNLQKIYYEWLIKPTLRKAYKIITVSDYSKKKIIEWSGVPENKVIIVHGGVSQYFSTQNKKHAPGYPYVLHVGNTKKHKNIERLIQAFANAKIDSSIRLILTGKNSEKLTALIQKNHLQDRIVFSGILSEEKLAEYYSGALAFLFPSLYEGFGLPVLEAMASGIPVLTANTTSLPEVAGDAALLVDPVSMDAISRNIEKIVDDSELRKILIKKGLERVKHFSWEKAAERVQSVLDIA